VDATCRAFRTAWLSDALRAQALAHECAACEEWRRSSERQQRALAALGRLGAPPALDERLAQELAGDRSRRLERVLGSLVRLAAPAELDERVAGLFGTAPRVGDEERGRQKAEVLRALDVQPAPPVLDRLLNEELELPSLHRAERFPGGLGRLAAPPELDARLATHARRRNVRRLLLAPLATLAAAGLVVWIVARQPSPEPRVHRITIVQSSLGELDPLARSLAEGLSGFSGEAR